MSSTRWHRTWETNSGSPQMVSRHSWRRWGLCMSLCVNDVRWTLAAPDLLRTRGYQSILPLIDEETETQGGWWLSQGHEARSRENPHESRKSLMWYCGWRKCFLSNDIPPWTVLFACLYFASWGISPILWWDESLKAETTEGQSWSTIDSHRCW